jgi:hypothetical protein
MEVAGRWNPGTYLFCTFLLERSHKSDDIQLTSNVTQAGCSFLDHESDKGGITDLAFSKRKNPQSESCPQRIWDGGKKGDWLFASEGRILRAIHSHMQWKAELGLLHSEFYLPS